LLREKDSNPRPQGYEPCKLPLLYPAILSERGDSNSRPSPWQGDALPAELLSLVKKQSSMLTMVVDFTNGWFPVTCYECTIEQGPSHSILGHLILLGNYSHKPRFLSMGANPILCKKVSLSGEVVLPHHLCTGRTTSFSKLFLRRGRYEYPVTLESDSLQAVSFLSSIHTLSHQRDSNPRPTDYKSVALPTELWWLVGSCFVVQLPKPCPITRRLWCQLQQLCQQQQSCQQQ
jgi:hypothetical protein